MHYKAHALCTHAARVYIFVLVAVPPLTFKVGSASKPLPLELTFSFNAGRQERHELTKEQELKRIAVERDWKAEMTSLTSAQALEYQQHVELITKAAALEEVRREFPRGSHSSRCT